MKSRVIELFGITLFIAILAWQEWRIWDAHVRLSKASEAYSKIVATLFDLERRQSDFETKSNNAVSEIEDVLKNLEEKDEAINADLVRLNADASEMRLREASRILDSHFQSESAPEDRVRSRDELLKWLNEDVQKPDNGNAIKPSGANEGRR